MHYMCWCMKTKNRCVFTISLSLAKHVHYEKTEPLWHCIYIKFHWTWSIATYSDQKVNFGCLSNKSQQWRLQWIIAELIYFIQHSFKIVTGTVLSGSDRVLIFFFKKPTWSLLSMSFQTVEELLLARPWALTLRTQKWTWHQVCTQEFYMGNRKKINENKNTVIIRWE